MTGPRIGSLTLEFTPTLETTDVTEVREEALDLGARVDMADPTHDGCATPSELDMAAKLDAAIARGRACVECGGSGAVPAIDEYGPTLEQCGLCCGKSAEQ